MSNSVYIETFDDGPETRIEVSDNYDTGEFFCDGVVVDDLMILRECVKSSDPVVIGIMECVEENEMEVSIDGCKYPWDKIKHIFDA